YRHRAKLTQEELAECVDVEIATISRYENGAVLPSLVTLETLANVLHCGMADLLDEKLPDKSPEGERIEAMIEPLLLAERELVVQLIEAAVRFLRKRTAGRPRKRAPSRRSEDTEST
ncbi:MAG: helix-turn-helix transcriptional regulator, partial [Pseudomonadota bacterium]|nr:helix-turn-helix transcriptional regulator [Pseudomonadota bacterium]